MLRHGCSEDGNHAIDNVNVSTADIRLFNGSLRGSGRVPTQLSSKPPIEWGDRAITGSFTRVVTQTANISGRLPNAIFTLPVPVIRALFGRADLPHAAAQSWPALCQKFFIAFNQYERDGIEMTDGGTTITLDCGRLFSEGRNNFGQCGVGSDEREVPDPRLIRLPPVLQLWYGGNSFYAQTTRGIYAWGNNKSNFLKCKLGLGTSVYRVTSPTRVSVEDDIIDVIMCEAAIFMRSVNRWLGCGSNEYGQLGLGHTDEVTAPTPIPGSEGVTHWMSTGKSSFAWTSRGLLACGRNVSGECGVGSTELHITTLTPVALPDDVKRRVTSINQSTIALATSQTFIRCGTRCFACGDNQCGQLGVSSPAEKLFTPAELPFPVSDLASSLTSAVFAVPQEDGSTQLLVCGANHFKQLTDGPPRVIRPPTPFSTPGPITDIVIEPFVTFVRRDHGGWVGRGKYDPKLFGPVPRTALVRLALRGWTAAAGEEVAVLERANGSHTMAFEMWEE